VVLTQPILTAVPTVVGSFPHTDAAALVERILGWLPDMPAWPQLPARDFRESMYVQYAEGLPGAVIDVDAQRLTFQPDEQFPAELERFYQAVVEEDVERFAVSRTRALGLHLFLERLRKLPQKPAWAKGQVTGPFSFAMTVTDGNKRSLAYTPELKEVAFQGMALKARWMARRLREVAVSALVVLDEPYLCSFGSAFVNVSREEVAAAIEVAATAVHAEGARCGVHCCGNTDWSLVLAAPVDVVNFDAFEYLQGLSLYPRELADFVGRGGILSWGIVPTSGAHGDVTAPALCRRLRDGVRELTRKGLDEDLLFAQMLLTPSCGMGTLGVVEAEATVTKLVEVAGRVRHGEARG